VHPVAARPLGKLHETDTNTHVSVCLLTEARTADNPGHDQVLSILGVADELRRDGLVFPDTPAAIRYARTIALDTPQLAAR
jgi:hypothetical protein